MTVYVDDMNAGFGRLKMSHMIADTETELHAMADRIGVARRWYQHDHYDIALSKRVAAVAAGALQITWRQAGAMSMLRRRDPNVTLADPAQAASLLAEKRKARVAAARRRFSDGRWEGCSSSLDFDG